MRKKAIEYYKKYKIFEISMNEDKYNREPFPHAVEKAPC
jgi:hypothetical protein